MKERPILFNTEMVQAILDGRKTQTRRVMKPQPNEEGVTYMKSPPVLDWEQIYNEEWKPFLFDTEEGERIAIHPPYQTGDILWVRETWNEEKDDSVGFSEFVYKSDFDDISKSLYKWKPSIFMPKEAARIWLKVTDVRCERLKDISEGDVWSEGVKVKGITRYQGESIHLFEFLWKSTNSPYSWMENPWVWVYEFEVISTTGKPEAK